MYVANALDNERIFTRWHKNLYLIMKQFKGKLFI